jgi:uncharacterized protein (DUF58 family)
MHRLHTTITREGWYYLIITAIVFAGAMLKGVNLLLVLSGMMMGLWLFHWQALFVSLRGLKVQRKAPQAVCAGDLLAVGLQLTNTRPHFGSWAVSIEERFEREPGAGESNGRNHYNVRHQQDAPISTSVLVPYIPAGGQRTGTYHGRLVRRGRYRMGPMRISSRFPFGLLCRKITVGESETIYVCPRLGRLTRRWLARRRQALAGADRRQSRPGPEGDFYGVREWRSGDSLKLIHWRSSARTGKLVVRQFEQPHNRDVAIALDLWAPERPTAEQLDSVELAISFAATVLADLCRQGGGKVHLGLHNGETNCLGGPASPALLSDMMKLLAVLEPASDDHLPGLLGHVLAEVGAGTETIVVSTRAVDLADNKRFAAIYSDTAMHAAARNIRAIDASSNELEEYFVAE